MGIEGTLDAFRGGALYGWAWDSARPDVPVSVEMRDHQSGALLGTALADVFRSDLLRAGKGNGEHGFRCDLANGGAVWVSAFVAGSEQPLHNSPLQIPEPPSGLARAERLRDRYCTMPFEKLVLDAGGDVHLCCPAYVPVVVGNANREPLAAIWRSERARDVRRSVIGGDFRFCLDICPYIQQGSLPRLSDLAPEAVAAMVASADGGLESGPVQLSLLHDRSCNLSCPSCRTDLIGSSPAEQKRLRHLLDEGIRPLLGSVKVLELAGGEFLASSHLREVVASIDRLQHPDLRLLIFSNATLFDRAAWEQLRNVHGLIGQINISLDAARADTFEELRRGARWDATLANVELVAQLRRDGEMAAFGILFVVQARNFAEMKAFVELGQRLGCDLVRFNRILDFGTFTDGSFDARDVVAAGHPRHGELLEALRDPIFDLPCVDLTNLWEVRQQALAALGPSVAPEDAVATPA